MTVVKLQSRPRIGDVVALPQGKRIRVRNIGIPYVLPPGAAGDRPLRPRPGHP